jgi:uncharacterized protein (DUF885 family)
MKRFILCIAMLTALCGQGNAANTGSQDAAFNQYKKGFVDRLWKTYPEWATALGYHKYDSSLTIMNPAEIQKEIRFATDELKKLKAFNADQLSPLNKIDHHVIEAQLKYQLFTLTELKDYEWNPANYNVGQTFGYILSENYAPLKKRMSDLFIKLEKVPAFYEAAKKNIHNPAQVYVNLAIDQNEGSIPILETDFVDSVKMLHLSKTLEVAYLKRAMDAVYAMRQYVQFLKDFKSDSMRSFRLGEPLYSKMFELFIQSQYTPDEIFNAAVKRKEYLHNEMEKLARQLWPKYFGSEPMPEDRMVLIKKVIDTISLQHCRPEDFRATIEKQLPELTKFVAEKNLLYMDPSKPLMVRKEPGYMAGVAGASMSSPGPYETTGTAYYNVGTLDGWSPEKAESYLREYNDYVLQILNIHEAIPGHYVQFIYSNKSPSIIKSIFPNGAMIEGWAVYGELMMLENRYGNNEPEMWLMYYKWNLRSVCNTILDISVHTKNMSHDEVLDLLIRQAFQQKTEAENKWHRVQVSYVQLTSYFTGFKEITDLREEYKAKMGNAYSLKEFNESFLSYGSSPVKYIRELMLKK